METSEGLDGDIAEEVDEDIQHRRTFTTLWTLENIVIIGWITFESTYIRSKESIVT